LKTPCTGCIEHDAFATNSPSICTDAPIDNGIELNTGSPTNQYLSVPKDVFASLDNEITIAFWAKGYGPSFPRQNNVFEGLDSNSNRLLGSHLPWTNGQVYWDAGNSSGYDRINATAPTTLTHDVWTHWTFTKNATAGTMEIYTNGELFHSGTGKNREFNTAIEQFRIGRAANNSSLYWPGCLDDFRLYSPALSADSVSKLHREGVPYYQWAKQHFTGLDYDDEGISASTVGNNLLHYAFNTAPENPDINLMPTADGEGFSFTQRKNIPRDLTYTVELSTTLGENDWDDMNTLWEEYAPRQKGTAIQRSLHDISRDLPR